MTKTIALFVDSYRQLNAKRLFWFALAINALIVMLFAAIGLKGGYISVFWWQTPWPSFFSGPAALYKWMFTDLAVKYWLTWAATILGLVSTTEIFPDFLASGSVDLYLSKPISRFWLFLMKYLGGLLFVTLQVALFAFVNFLVIGIRGGEWDPRIFMSIPLVAAVFSFVFCFCVFFGTLTASSITSLLLTLLIWLMISGIQSTETVVLTFQVHRDLKIASLEARLAPDANLKSTTHRSTSSFTRMLPFGIGAETKAQMQTALTTLRSEHFVDRLHRIFFVADAVIPKTQVATDLLNQYFKVDEDRTDWSGYAPDFPDNQSMGQITPEQGQYIGWRVGQIQNSRGLLWSLGTSFVSEFLIVGFAAWRFCQRDF